MSKMVVLYCLACAIIIAGLFCLKSAFRRPTIKEKMEGKELELTGKGSKIHLVFLGFTFILLGFYILYRS